MTSHMDFKIALQSSCVALDLKSDTKEGIIEEMVDLLASGGKIRDKSSVLKAILERESKMSTGMQCGIAIPHGKTDAVDGLITAIALKKEGMDFSSMDGEPSRIFVMTVSAVDRTGPHIEFLAAISRLLNSKDVRDRLIQAGSREDVIRILTE